MKKISPADAERLGELYGEIKTIVEKHSLSTVLAIDLGKDSTVLVGGITYKILALITAVLCNVAEENQTCPSPQELLLIINDMLEKGV